MKVTIQKFILPSLTIALLIGLMGISACEDPGKLCRITQFNWEGFDYTLVYSGNRLDQLVATDSHVDLKYNEMDQLIAANHYLPGDGGTPSLYFEYKHGPDGISQIDQYNTASHKRYYLSYSGGKVDQIIEQELDGVGNVTLEFTITYTYNSNGNLTNEYGISPVIYFDYNIYEYDKAVNPFNILAAAVNHPQFFPLGTFVRFPVSNFDISVANRFSNNNPVNGEYQLPSLPAATEDWVQSYAGSLTTSIYWTYTEFGTVDDEKYGFVYDCLN